MVRRLLLRAAVICLWGFCPYTSKSQNCRLSCEFVSQDLIVKNKVLELRISKGDTTVNTLGHEFYWFSQDGCVSKHVYSDSRFPELKPIEELYEVDKNKNEQNFVRRRQAANGKYDIYNAERTKFTSSGIMYFKESVENFGVSKKTIERFDTLSSKNIDMTLYTFHTTDTMICVRHTFDGMTDIYFVREKTKGVWQERERTATIFRNDTAIDFIQYKNGNLVRHDDEKTLTKNPDHSFEGDFEGKENPLPVADPRAITRFTNDFKTFQDTDPKRKAKYRVVQVFDRTYPEKVYTTDVFDTNTQLIQSRIFHPDQKFNLVFSYTYNEK